MITGLYTFCFVDYFIAVFILIETIPLFVFEIHSACPRDFIKLIFTGRINKGYDTVQALVFPK